MAGNREAFDAMGSAIHHGYALHSLLFDSRRSYNLGTAGRFDLGTIVC